MFCQNTEYWCWWNPGSLWYFLARLSTILCKTILHKFYTSFICWCFRHSWPLVIVYGDTYFTKTRSPTGNCTTVHCSPPTSRRTLWISVGFLPRKVSILMYSLWSSTVTVRKAPAHTMFNTRQFETAYTREVTNMCCFLKSSTVTGITFIGIASSTLQFCHLVYYLWNDPCITVTASLLSASSPYQLLPFNRNGSPLEGKEVRMVTLKEVRGHRESTSSGIAAARNV